MSHNIDYLAKFKDHDIVRYMMLRSIKNNSHQANVAAVFEFDREISRIPFIITEPMAGFVRLQWWREHISHNNPISNQTEFLDRIQNMIYHSRHVEDMQKSFTDLLTSIELILERRKFNNAYEFYNLYIKPLSKSYATILSGILNFQLNKHIEALFEAYAIVAFIRSYDSLIDFGWELFNLPHKELQNLMRYADKKFKAVNQQYFQLKILRILFVAGAFFTKYYINNIPSREMSYYEPNMGLLKLKLIWTSLF